MTEPRSPRLMAVALPSRHSVTQAAGSRHAWAMVEGKRALRVMTCGEVFSLDGSSRGSITEDDLLEMVRVFDAAPAVVGIDWGHASSPWLFEDVQPPETAGSLGEVRELHVLDEGDGRGPGLYAVVEHTARGLQVVADHRLEDGPGGEPRSALYSSPEFVVGLPVADAATGETIGTAIMLHLAYTTRPAQREDLIDSIALQQAPAAGRDGEAPVADEKPAVAPEDEVQANADGDGLDMAARIAELESALLAKDEEIAVLKAQLEDEPVEAMAEDTGDEDMEDEDVAALSQQLSGLSGQVQALTARAEKAEAEAYAAKRAAALDGLVSSGRITPAEREQAEQAYDVEHDPAYGGKAKLYTSMFSSRERGQAVPVGERMSTQAAPATDSEALDAEVRAYCAEHKLDPKRGYVRALHAVQAARAARGVN